MSKGHIQIYFLIFVGLLSSSTLSAMTVAEDLASRKIYKRKCLEIKKYVVDNKLKVECHLNYHSFNSDSSKKYYSHKKAIKAGDVKIASYNMLHPGSLRSGFKDYELLAKIINKWDVVAGLELLPVLGRDDRLNDTVVEYLTNTSLRTLELKKQLEVLTISIKNNSDINEEITQIENEIQKLELLANSHKGLYRSPGYLKILTELRKSDPSWSLILSPKGEAAEVSHVHELVGFFYRASRVKPIANEHCKEFKGRLGGEGVACIPNLRKPFMDADVTEVFSRRPLLASFKSGNFDFSMLASHVVYGSPSDLDTMKKILLPSFGVESYENIGIGVTKQTYARWAETKIILKFMKRLRESYDEQDIIYGGDMNLESTNRYFSELLKDFPGEELFIEAQTTLSQPRYHNQGMPTYGLSNNYDHFIYNKTSTKECLTPNKQTTAKVYPYYSGMVEAYISDKYQVRDDKYFDIETYFSPAEIEAGAKNDYVLLPDASDKMDEAQNQYRKILKKLKRIDDDEIVLDDYRLEERVVLFKKRVFTDQLTDKFFYRHYLELLSDHMPIEMSCKNSQLDDDK